MSTFPVDDGIPLPPDGRLGNARKYPLGTMEVGQSFFVPGNPQSLRNSICGCIFSVRAVTEDGVSGVRVWRIS